VAICNVYYIATLQTKEVSKLHSLFGRKHRAFFEGGSTIRYVNIEE